LIPVDGSRVEGYLMQANAISGCSGAPVFSTRTVILKLPKHKVAGSSGNLNLIGVWSSSWKVKQSEIVAVRSDARDARTLPPFGMGVVTPLSKLVDILRMR
jgi:hypothetical protein